MKERQKASERVSAVECLTAACILSAVGGFLDIYSYLLRGHVFANAVTGNIVLLGLGTATTAWSNCGKYLWAILSYALGVFTAGFISKCSASRHFIWHQIVLLIEIGCLILIPFIPHGKPDLIVNALISFVCALQVQAFRRVHGHPFASTMCTGNLRSGTNALFHALHLKNASCLAEASRYYAVILCFICGAATGSLLLPRFGERIFCIAPLGLLVGFCLVTTKHQLVGLRRTIRTFFARCSSENSGTLCGKF